MQQQLRREEEEEGEMDEDERDGASVWRRHERWQDDEARRQDGDHVGEERVSLADVLRAETLMKHSS